MTTKKTDYRAGVFNSDYPFFKLTGVFLLIFGMLCLPITHLAADSIKFATLAPKGSTWMNNFEAMGKEIRAKTDSELQLRIYPNGVQGDELDVIRKMRAGLLHAGAMTATGLGEIQKEVLIFQLPAGCSKPMRNWIMSETFSAKILTKPSWRLDMSSSVWETSASITFLAINRSALLPIFNPRPSKCGFGQPTESVSNFTKTPRSQLYREKLHRCCLRSTPGRSTL